MKKFDQDWVNVQHRTFTAWANSHLRKRSVKIDDLISGLHTGVNLVSLLELLTSKNVPVAINKNPTFRIQKIQNNSIAVDFAKAEKVNVIGCGAEDLVDGELKIILGFIWTLILKYQINKDRNAAKAQAKRKKAVQKGETKIEIELSDEQKQEIRKAFESLTGSTASDAALTDIQSVITALQTLGYDITEEELQALIEQLKEEYAKQGIDKNIDVLNGGKIDFETFSELVKKKIQRDEMKKAFSTFDIDGSGRLAVDDVLAALKSLGFENISREDIEQFMAEIVASSNGEMDGKVEFEEFVKLVMTKLQQKEAARLAAASGTEKTETKPTTQATTQTNPKGELLSWVAEMLEKYTNGGKVSDFTKMWQDGKLLASLVHSLAPKSVKSQIDLNEQDPLTLTQTAVRVAEEEMGIPMIVDPADVVNNPEELSMMTYISYFRDYAIERGSEEEQEEEADPDQCSVALTTVKPLIFTEETVTFVITSRGLEGELREGINDEFEVSLSGPEEVEPVVKSNGDGTYNVSFVPKVSGEYKLFVAINGSGIQNAPVKVIIKDPVSPAHTTIVGIEETIVAGFPAEFTIQSKNKHSSDCSFGGFGFDVQIIGPVMKVTPTISDNRDGTYSVSWTPEETGSFSIAVGGGDIEIDQSPYFVLVRRQVAPRNCVAEGTALNQVLRPNAPTTVTIQTKDENGDNILTGSENVKVSIDAPGGAVICPDVSDNGNGTYVSTFSLEKPGENIVTITVNDEPIKASPFTISVEPELHAPSTNASLERTKVKPDGCTVHFNVQPLDKFGNTAKTPSNIVATVSDENGAAIETKLVEFNGDNFAAFFKPKPNRYNYKLGLSINNVALKNSPLNFTLVPTIDPSLCIVEGPGLEGGDLISRLGFPAIFTIHAKDIDGNDMPDEPNDAKDFVSNEEIIMRYYHHQDTPIVPPTMEKSKTRRGAIKREDDLGPSPINPMYYRCRYTNQVVETSEEEVELQNPLWQDPETEPQFESANSLYEEVDMERMERLKQSSPFVVRIAADDAEEEIEPFIVKSAPSEYTVMYTTPFAGIHTISIQYDGQDVVGSPFQATFTKGIDPRRSNMTGPGTKKAYANVRTCFDIYAVDQDGRLKKVGGDDFEVVIKDPTGTSIKEPVVVDDRGDGTYKCYYTPQMEGPHTVKVKCKGVELPNSSVRIQALSRSRMPDVKKIRLASTTPIVYAKTPSSITVTLPDTTSGGDNVEVDFVTPIAGLVIRNPVVKDNGNGTYSVFYEAPLPGTYKCKVTVNNEPVETALEFAVVADLNPTITTIGNWSADISSVVPLVTKDFTIQYDGHSDLEATHSEKSFKLHYDAPTNEEEIDETHIIDIKIKDQTIGGAPFRQAF